MGFGVLLLIIIAAAVLFDGGAFLERFRNSRDNSGSENPSKPLQILDTRLARGEIDLDEYNQIRSQLESTEVSA